MDPPRSQDEGSSLFPMAMACTGCATRYRIDKPRGFTCPHCGNHIQVLEDGKVEIVPKAILEKEIQEIADIKEPGSTEKGSMDSKDKEEQDPGLAEKTGADHETPSETHEPDEQVVEIRAGRGKPGHPPAAHDRDTEGEDRDSVANAEMVGDEEEREADAVMVRGAKERVADAEMARDTQESEQVLEEEIRREEARLEQLRKSRELLEKKKLVGTRTTGIPVSVGGRGVEDGREKLPPPVIPSYYGKGRRELRLPFDGDLKKNALAAVLVAMVLLVSIIAYSALTAEDFTVQMPGEKIGDRGSYQVDGRIWASSSDGISLGTGIIRDLKIYLNGPMSYWINNTAVKKDGFGMDRDTIDRYFNQDLQLSGSAQLVTGDNLEISDAGSMKSKVSTYTCLVMNETVQTNVTNDLDLDILTTYSLRTIDRGTYYPSGETLDYNLFDLRNRDYSLGDEGYFAGGQLRWKAEEKEKVHKWDCIRLHITENNSNSDWRRFSADVWVANECSLPVKIHISMRVDSTKLSPALKLVFSLFTSTNGFLEIDYTATMKGYTRGDRSIPWDLLGDDPRVWQRPDVQFDRNWTYAPLIRNDSESFDPEFSPESAADFAIEQSSELRSFVDRHEDEVYIVDGQYSRMNDTQYWQLLFGYRESGIATTADAYNITIEKNGTVLDVFSDPGEETVNNPSNSREEIEQAMNIADSEGIFRNMTYLRPLFTGDRVDFTNDANGKIIFNIQNNYLHTGLSLTSSINSLIQNTVPAGYGYYLHRERQMGNKFYFEEGMIDAENGRIIYEIDHYQSGQF